MSDKLPISVALVTLDAERCLDRVLSALPPCDQILLLDCGSTDSTRAIADRHGADWHEHPFDGFGPQKQRAVALGRNDWVLSLDADEVLDADAAAALTGIPFGDVDPHTCWRIRRRTFVGQREIRHGVWVPDRVVRLFHRRHHDFDDAVVHESVRPDGPVEDLAGSVLHFSYEHMADIFRPRYHQLKAQKYRALGRRAGGLALAFRASWAFTDSYLLRRGFLDGPAGVVVAVSAAASEVVGLAMATEADPPERAD